LLGQAEQARRGSGSPAKSFGFLRRPLAVRSVAALDRGQHLELFAEFLSELGKRDDVPRECAAGERRTGRKIGLRADATLALESARPPGIGSRGFAIRATSFINVMETARKELIACLVISADSERIQTTET